MAKSYTKTKTIDGVEYTAQFNGLEAASRMVDECHLDGNSSNLSAVKTNNYVLQNFIVKPPGLTMDSFDNFDTLNEVVEFGMQVAQGNFRDEAKKSG